MSLFDKLAHEKYWRPHKNRNILWYKDISGVCMLLVEFSEKVKISVADLRLKGFDLRLVYKDKIITLILALKDSSYADVFEKLGNDLIEITSSDEQEYAGFILKRLNLWMEFLSKERNKYLDIRKQLGLSGELFVIKQYRNKSIPLKYLIEAWKGPERTPQDYLFTYSHLEIKSIMDSESSVRISSEKQLEQKAVRLYLGVFKFKEDCYGQTVKDIIDELLVAVSIEAPDILELFQKKLLLYGYMLYENYENLINISVVSITYYEVKTGFPCIVSHNINSGISNVQYDLDLNHCHSFITGEPDFGFDNEEF